MDKIPESKKFIVDEDRAAEIERRARAFLLQSAKVEELSISLSRAWYELQLADDALTDLVHGADTQFLLIDLQLIQIDSEPESGRRNCQVLDLTTPQQLACEIEECCGDIPDAFN